MRNRCWKYDTNPNLRLTERLCTTKAVRKSHTELGRKRREPMWLGPVPLGRDLKREGGLHGQRPSLGSDWFEPHIEHPRYGTQEEEFPWLEG